MDAGSGVEISDPAPESKFCEKLDSDPESLFNFGNSRSLCDHILSKTWVNYSWIDDCSRSLNRNRILKFDKFTDPDPKI